MKKWKLFLDDVRQPHFVYPDESGFILAKNMDEAVELIKLRGCPSFISFDHDLAEDHYAPVDPRYKKPSESPTGYDFAKWLVFKDLESKFEFLPDDFTYKVHSMNPVGAENIRKYLESYLEFRYLEKCRRECVYKSANI